MKLVLPQSLASGVVPQISSLAAQVEVVLLDEEGQPEGDIADAEIFVRWWYNPDVLARLLAAMPRLRWLHTLSAGVDGLLSPGLRERGLLITNASGSHAAPIAEFVLLAMLLHAKQGRALLEAQAERHWLHDETQLDELSSKTLLIVGLGSIGRAVAQRAAAFDMCVLGSRRTPQPMEGVELVVGEGAWRDLLPQADYIALCTPLTAATRGMVDAAALALVQPHAYLINIARGELIDDQALLAALREERISGALLDAFAEEPLPTDHPYWSLPNVTVTPHISWSSPLVRERNIALFVENLRRYLRGEELRNIVDLDAGY